MAELHVVERLLSKEEQILTAGLATAAQKATLLETANSDLQSRLSIAEQAVLDLQTRLTAVEQAIVKLQKLEAIK